MARSLIFAAGGIVMRGGAQPLIAVVQLRKDDAWVLPKGKLDDDESAFDAARREAIEETGHDVVVHEFLGTLSYDVKKKPKIVQFWRMAASEKPIRALMRDVKAVDWLPLAKAIDRLSHPRERLFLEQVGPTALRALSQPGEAAKVEPVDFVYRPSHKGFVDSIRAWLQGDR